MAKGFNFEQTVAPVQYVETDTSGGNGGDGGESGALAFGYSEADAGDGGLAVGGDGGGASGGDGTGLGVGGRGGDSSAESDDGGDANQFGLLNLNLFSDLEGGDSEADSEGGDGAAGLGLGAGGAGGTGGAGGDADADGGDAAALNFTSANSSADGAAGGNGGNATVTPTQNTTVENDFEFEDSFNEETNNITIKDSGNSDDDGFDNSGGKIEDSVVAGDDINDSFNTEYEVEVEDSFNDNRQYDVDNDDIEIEDSFNREDNDFLDLDLLNDLNIG